MMSTGFTPFDGATLALKRQEQSSYTAPNGDATAAQAPPSPDATRPVVNVDTARDESIRNNDPKTAENARLSGAADDDTHYEVSVDKDTGQRIFKHVVASSGYVLWQYPEEKMLDHAREENKFEGVFADMYV